ncbi:hypothetical protein LNQ03_11760 [Klebsiella pneumoniae subsp. pneumoniae]|nr:hypothetical protein [Klebsiella pneumoniae subsp. pneumoniae]
MVVSEGRAYPVERRFSPLSAHQRFDEAVAVAVAELLRHEQGSMLLFLPGVGGDPARSGTADGARGGGCRSLPAVWRVALKRTAQSDPPGAGRKRKVVLATSIAETSLTIEGIRLVVDSAQERVARFDPRTGLTRLVTQRISQASMTQRAGRAGRLSPGICLHLLGKEQAERAAAQSEAGDPAQRSVGAVAGAAAVGLPRSGRAGLAGSAARGQSGRRAACWRRCRRWTASGCRRLAAKWQRLGNEPRLAAMLAAAQTDDEAATAAKLAAIPRGRRAADWWIWGPSFPVSRPTGSSERSS